MDIWFWLILLSSFFVFAYLLKTFFNAKTFLFFSMVKSENIAKYIDKFASKKVWDFIGLSGVFFGFGFFGIYYWYRKKSLSKIIIWQSILFIISLFIVLKLYSVLGLVNSVIALVLFNLSGLSGFGLYLLGFYSVKILINYFYGRLSCPGVAPVIPGIDIPNVPISVPFFEGWLAILIILVVHELAHGILARIAKIQVKSFGLILVGFLPIGAFTEPDETQLQKAKDKDQLKVYSAGASSNLYLAVIFVLLSLVLALLFSGYISNVNQEMSDGLYIIEFNQYTQMCGEGVKSLNYGLYDNNLRIISIDSYKIKDFNDFYHAQRSAIDNNQTTMLFKLQNREDMNIFDSNLIINSDKKLGISVGTIKKENADVSLYYHIIEFFISLSGWLVILNIGVAMVNFLPTEPFDGGKMAKIIYGDLFMPKMDKKKRYRLIGMIFGIIVLCLIIINLLPLFF